MLISLIKRLPPFSLALGRGNDRLVPFFGFALIAFYVNGSQRPDCRKNPNPSAWFVKAGAAPETGVGTQAKPFASLADAEQCSAERTTIFVLPATPGSPPLDGGIVLKNGQKLLGATFRKAAGWLAQSGQRVTNTRSPGDAVVLANDNEVAYLHIEGPAGAAILGDNVAGTNLHDLLITREKAVASLRLHPSLCRVVTVGDDVDNAASTLRGCHVFLQAAAKSPITFLADAEAGDPSNTHTVRRVVITDSPASENPELLWSAAIYIIAAGQADMTVNLAEVSIENSLRGIIARATDRATVALNVSDTRMDNLTSDGISLQTGFICSGKQKGYPIPEDIGGGQCGVNTSRGPLPPSSPLSDAKLLLNARRFRFTDTKNRGRTEAAAMETVALDQGRSVIEVHVEDSDLIGASAPGFFTYYVTGRPDRDIIDFGCVNPESKGVTKDRTACRAQGYTSRGRNRIFGNSRKWAPTSNVELGLIGPGAMMAQGNYWGDIVPRDGLGDAVGECSVWDPSVQEPTGALDKSRCGLWSVSSQGRPRGIDARFHLIKDPRR